MKISAFHLMPYRELPADFEKRYESVWVTPPWWELADARRVGQYYNWTLDELTYAAQCGFDGLHQRASHQNAYGFMPSPNLMGSVLARATNGTDVAIVQMGATLPTSNPPLRVARSTPCSTASAAGGSWRACHSGARWTSTSATASRPWSTASGIARPSRSP